MTPDYLSLADPDAAALISTRVRQWDTEDRVRYATLGLMVLAVEKRLLWQYVIDPDDGLPCRSLARWIRVCAPNAYSTCYAAKRDVEELQDVPADDLAQIPQSNMKTMKLLSTAVRRDPAVLKVAKTQRTEALVAHVKENHPEQHLEAPTKLLLNLTEIAKAEIEEAMQLAIERGDSHTKEEAVLMWAIEYKQNHQSPLQEVADADCGHA